MSDSNAAPRALRRIPTRLLLFGLVAVASFWLGFLAFDVEQSRILIRRYGYYTIALTFAWAGWSWWRLAPAFRAEVSRVARREWLQAGGVVLACTMVAVLTTPINYKILFDEVVLQATAHDMHIYREVSTVVRAYLVDGVFAPFDTYLDKRPFFFPFVVSLLHDVTGYREGNAFVVNIALLPLILTQSYLLARRFANHASGIAVMLALGTVSALGHAATGCGMETLNLAMLLFTMQLAVLYLDAPDGPRLSALVLSAVLLAQARYESSLFVLPVALVVLEGWRRVGQLLLPPAAIAAPALLIPYAVHNTYLSGTPSLWELRENVQSRFGLQHLLPNLRHAWEYLFARGDTLTNSLWLSAAGLLALLIGVVALWRRRAHWRSAPPVVVAVVGFGAAILGNLAVLMFYYWGQLDDPAVARLALPFFALLALAIGYAVHRFDDSRRRLAWLAAGGACLSYLATGVVANEQHSKRNTLETEIQWECRFVEALPPGERLVLSNKSALPWMLRKISAISIERARRRVGELRTALEQQTFREILVTQSLRATSETGEFHLDPADRLPDWFVLETIQEKRFGAHLSRLSRLVAIKAHSPESEESP